MDTRPHDRQNLLWVRRPRLGDQMSAWIATALTIAISAVSTITDVNAALARREARTTVSICQPDSISARFP
jgi:hypothetical protein